MEDRVYCKDCKWWDDAEEYPDPAGALRRECHGGPPTAISVKGALVGIGCWPWTAEHDYCKKGERAEEWIR